ncbi:hypothetical protein EG328_001246 [Venturia inaequalis]|uniref:Uncharacterized protein n=1 Tax=Venturia inaequalis TaxID=5025 RepID=A0A8H3YYG4_VENIN|nr:hypothetical protein EG328_001246 [Venturia inaequalis]
MFKNTAVVFLALAMAFNTMAAPLPVPVAGVAAEAKRAEIETRDPTMGRNGCGSGC